MNQFLVEKNNNLKGGEGSNDPVEITVTYNNSVQASLFLLKHRKGGHHTFAEDFDNFNRCFSNRLLTLMLKTQCFEDSDFKIAIQHLSHALYNLNPNS